MSERRLYHPGAPVKVPGIYVSAGGTKRVALAIGESFPKAPTAGTGWTLEERLSVERNPAYLQAPAPTSSPIVIDPAAMEYAIDRAYAAAWNSALRELEAKILSNGRTSRAHILELIEELRIRRRMPAEKEGDPSDGG